MRLYTLSQGVGVPCASRRSVWTNCSRPSMAEPRASHDCRRDRRLRAAGRHDRPDLVGRRVRPRPGYWCRRKLNRPRTMRDDDARHIRRFVLDRRAPLRGQRQHQPHGLAQPPRDRRRSGCCCRTRCVSGRSVTSRMVTFGHAEDRAFLLHRAAVGHARRSASRSSLTKSKKPSGSSRRTCAGSGSRPSRFSRSAVRGMHAEEHRQAVLARHARPRRSTSRASRAGSSTFSARCIVSRK